MCPDCQGDGQTTLTRYFVLGSIFPSATSCSDGDAPRSECRPWPARGRAFQQRRQQQQQHQHHHYEVGRLTTNCSIHAASHRFCSRFLSPHHPLPRLSLIDEHPLAFATSHGFPSLLLRHDKIAICAVLPDACLVSLARSLARLARFLAVSLIRPARRCVAQFRQACASTPSEKKQASAFLPQDVASATPNASHRIA